MTQINLARRNYYIASLISLLLTYWVGDMADLIARIEAAKALPDYGMPDPLSLTD